MTGGEAHRRAGRGERLDRRPVDHLRRRRDRAQAARAEAAQQRLHADVDADEPHDVTDVRQVEVRGAHDAHAVDVDQLVVDHVPGERHLAVARHEVAQVDALSSAA